MFTVFENKLVEKTFQTGKLPSYQAIMAVALRGKSPATFALPPPRDPKDPKNQYVVDPWRPLKVHRLLEPATLVSQAGKKGRKETIQATDATTLVEGS